MKISKDGLQLIKRLEGCVLKVYLDEAKLQTIGVGHLLTKDEIESKKFENGITDDEAIDLLKLDVVIAENAVNRLVKQQITQQQFDALVSLVFNIGETAFSKSTLLKRINEKNFDTAAMEFLKWNKVRDPKTKKLKISNGLTKRRVIESDLFKQKIEDDQTL